MSDERDGLARELVYDRKSGKWVGKTITTNSTHTDDPVNHPSHYTTYKGVEIIQLTEQMNFCRGNAVKYIARAGLKDPATEIQDLEKAVWYIKREIERIKDGQEVG